MPNIEIHGLNEADAEAVYEEIVDHFKGTSYYNEMVVTIYQTKVRNLKRGNQPFIRLLNSCQLHTEEIMLTLKRILPWLDIERGKLEEFSEKTKSS
jgi:hypothetical protein